MSWIKVAKFALWAIYSIVTACILIEISLQLLPTADLFDRQPVNAEQPILRYVPNQSITYSLGADFYQIAEKKTNNLGFVTDKDYTRNGRPFAAVIGDSYVQAMQVDYSRSITGLLEEYTGKRIYSFGISGAALSQYLAYAAYVQSEFNPGRLIFVVVGNDFDESLCAVRPYPGNHCFTDGFKLKLIDFGGDSTLKGLAKKSAFVRYVVLNLGLDWRRFLNGDWRAFIPFAHVPTDADDHPLYAGNTSYRKESEVESSSLKAINHFVKEANAIAGNKPMLIVVDADREEVYAGEFRNSYFNRMRIHLIETAKSHGIEVVDLREAFKREHQQSGRKFEFPTDGHWNETGHETAARAIIESDFLAVKR